MKELILLRHGDHINPFHDGASRESSSTDEDRPDGEVTGVVKRYKKNEAGASTVTAIGMIKTSHTAAIEYMGVPTESRGLVISYCFLGALVVGSLGFYWLYDLLINGIHDDDIHKILDYAQAGFGSFAILMAAYVVLFGIRFELFRPEDEPIIFDRKNRKVYRVFRQTHPGLFGLFKPWPMYAAEYDWDLIDAEHNAVLTTTGSTAMRYHSLFLIVRSSAADPTIIDSFPIGNTFQFGELSVAPVWEHIRRFMEENGPHLPPGETISDRKAPHTWWESLKQIAPIGSAYKRQWKELAPVMIAYHVFFFVFIPIFVIWSFFNWMSYKTSRPILWPREVIEAVKNS